MWTRPKLIKPTRYWLELIWFRLYRYMLANSLCVRWVFKTELPSSAGHPGHVNDTLATRANSASSIRFHIIRGSRIMFSSWSWSHHVLTNLAPYPVYTCTFNPERNRFPPLRVFTLHQLIRINGFDPDSTKPPP